MMIESAVEATKMVLGVDDIIEKLFGPICLDLLFRNYELSAISRYRRAFWVGLDSRELNHIDSTGKYKVALRKFQYCFSSIENMIKQLKAYAKAFFYYKSNSKKAVNHHQHTLTTGPFPKHFFLLIG